MPAGKVTCLIGTSGCGKTTLLRCMNGLERLDSGTITFGELSVSAGVSELELSHVRRRVGVVFQELHLFPHLSVLDNITLAPIKAGGQRRKDAEARARELLGLVGLLEREGAYQSELSGGQKQRVAIARALAQGAHVLVLDEPTSALDPAARNELSAVLRQVAGAGVTMLIVTHDMRLVRASADEIWILHEGQIVERARDFNGLRQSVRPTAVKIATEWI